MKILYAASTGGHITSFHLPYIRRLAERGDEVHVAAPTRPEGLPDGVVFKPFPLEKKLLAPANFLCALRFSRTLRSERYDVISMHTSLAAFFMRLSLILGGGRRGARVVNTVHGYLFGEGVSAAKRTLLLAAEKFTRCVTDRVVVMNERDLQIAKNYRLSRGDIVFINGMGVDFSRFSPPTEEQRTEARKSFGFAEKDTVFVYAAEFSDRKNQMFLIRALAKLPENVKLLLAGKGELLDECRAAAEKLCAGRVVFPGHMSDIERALHAADVCVSSSRSEGLPFGIMEAMHTGLPVLASAVAGQTDLVRSGESGYLYPAEDEESFIEAAALLGDAETRRRMGMKAADASEKYSLENVFEENISALGF